MERPAPGGDCVAHAPDGRVVFLRGALPGERVRARVTDENRRLLRADTVEVLEASADRVAPPCPLAVPGRCGGLRLAARVGRRRSRAEGAGAARAADPARRHRPGAGGGRGRALVRGRPGMAHPGAGLRRTRRLARAASSPLARRRTGAATARSATRSWTRPAPGAATALPPTAFAISRSRGSAFAASPTTGAVVIDDDGTLVHRALDHDFRVTGGGFWQVHPDAAAAAGRRGRSPRSRRKPGERALDLYAGAGLFSYALGCSRRSR